MLRINSKSPFLENIQSGNAIKPIKTSQTINVVVLDGPAIVNMLKP